MHITIDCPACRTTVWLDARRIALLPRPAAHAPMPYAFVCPACQTPVIHEAAGIELLLLRSAGASSAGPEEARPGAQRSALPPLTRDDLLDFHLLLADERWVRRLTSPEDAQH